MKILLVHPDDSVEVGIWAGTRWDLVVDLGWSGRHAYLKQSARLGFQVSSIYDLLDHDQHRRQAYELLALGLDQLVDSQSVDWWDVFSPNLYDQVEQLLLLSALAEKLPARAEIFATRPHFMERALSLLLGRESKNGEIKSFLPERKPTSFRERSRRYVKAATTLRPSQVTDIIFDKWDSDYRVRRHFFRSLPRKSTPVILLPSAYGNVSRSQVAYAGMLPERRFLLVITRHNGVLRDLPGNVDVRWLASYAPGRLPSSDEECSRLLTRWNQLQSDVLESNNVFSVARKLDVFEGFKDFLRHMLRVRDAWQEVLTREPVTTVLSADESNPTTRLPILLASSRNLRTVFCDHGALNMSFGIRRPASQSYLLRSDMARDYSISWCGMPADKIIVGAPAGLRSPLTTSSESQRDWIVFFSEAYELLAGRTDVFYGELLPELCSLALQTNRKVVIKLHPFESLRMRQSIVKRTLSAEQRALVEIREGPMTPDLFERAWCSFTVESSVAVESTTNGVPCFLCSWMDASWYDYGKQYAKYSAGYRLDSPHKIREIPQLLEDFRITETMRQGLRTSISPERLDSVLCGNEAK